jgi:hypothetical protein
MTSATLERERASVGASSKMLAPPALWQCKLYYFTSSMGLACLLPFLPLIYARYGLTRAHIGAMGAIRPLVGAIANPCWAFLCDRSRAHNFIHCACLIAQAIGYGSLQRAHRTPTALFTWVATTEAFASCTSTLADAATGFMCARWNAANSIADGDVNAESYGRQRLWGAVSWGFVAAPLMGIIMSYSSETVKRNAPFVGYVIFIVVGACLSWLLRHDVGDEGKINADGNLMCSGEKDGEELTVMGDDEGRVSRIASANDLHAPVVKSMHARLWDVVRQVDVAFRFFGFFVSGASMAITDLFLFLWLQENNSSPAVMGVALLFTCVTEVWIFYNASWIRQRLSLDWSLILTPYCYFIRQMYYAQMFNIWSTAWSVLPVQLLHGITFGLYWSTANQFIQQISPPGLTTSMMGIFSGVNASGAFLGAVCGGIVYDKFGGDTLFAGIAWINLCMGVSFTALKLKYDKVSVKDRVQYTRLENVLEDDAY